jgi:hypothetical protein
MALYLHLVFTGICKDKECLEEARTTQRYEGSEIF